MSEQIEFSRTRPFLATIKDRRMLTGPTSDKQTLHLELDIATSGINYKVGDSLGIYPTNDPDLVQRIIHCVEGDGASLIKTREGQQMSLEVFLNAHANINRCSQKLAASVGATALSREVLEQYEVWDFLEEHVDKRRLVPQELCGLLGPMLPRFYSIASSPVIHPHEAHLTVALTEFETLGRRRLGVCSHYLSRLAPTQESVVPLYLQPSKEFTLPADSSASIIMVGPGTGVAPYRGFMQERVACAAPGNNWLFFGERNRATDFYYEEYWTELQRRGWLRLDTAFSRDQAEKIYVQHRIRERGHDIVRWLQDGAYFFVCGEAQAMAKDVDAVLHEILGQYGGLSADQAKAYVKQLRQEKRYLRDVY